MIADPSAPHYGYDLMKAAKLPSGTLYPMLARLQQDGLVEAEWEAQREATAGRPPRKYYRLSAEGLRVARLQRPAAAGRARCSVACAREHAVSPEPRTQRIAGWLIQTVCRRLPADVRAERCREWTAELPAILGDQSIRPSFLRTLRALSFCIGISWTARQLSRSARAASRRTRNTQWRTGALRTRPPALAVRAVRGLLIWLVVVAAVLGLIALLRTRGLPPSFP